jgi:hypothetical protein
MTHLSDTTGSIAPIPVVSGEETPPTRFNLAPLRAPFTIWPGSTFAEDGNRVEWWPAWPQVDGMTYWFNHENAEKGECMKVEHAIRCDRCKVAYRVSNGPPYRHLKRDELARLAAQHNEENGHV